MEERDIDDLSEVSNDDDDLSDFERGSSMNDLDSICSGHLSDIDMQDF